MYKESRNSVEDITRPKKEFRATVKATKREYWIEKVEDAKNDTNMHKLIRWTKPRPAKEAPPIQIGPDHWLSDPFERAIALRDFLLARFTAVNDTQTWDGGQPETILWHREIHIEDAKVATIQSKDTAPGSDKITVWLLKACWHTIGPYIRELYQACLNLEYFPFAFKVVEIVMPPKAGRDLSTAKGWRPISLISSIAKGLERLIAKRMSWLAITHQVVPQQLFGALPGRSAADLVTCAIHDVEAAMRSNRVTAMATLDVQGTFDAVLHGRLLQRMREQGWALSLCHLIKSFLTQRRVRIRHKHGVTDDKVMECSVPQGSPLFPLLFLLYVSILVQKGSPYSRFGYADDIAIVRTGRTPAEAVTSA